MSSKILFVGGGAETRIKNRRSELSSPHKLDMSHVDRLNQDCRQRAGFTYRQGYPFVLISKICAYFQGQCLTKRQCAYF